MKNIDKNSQKEDYKKLERMVERAEKEIAFFLSKNKGSFKKLQ